MKTTINVQEAADYLGVCTDTIYTMVRENQIPHLRIRRRIFFRTHTLEEWMNEQETKVEENQTA